MTKLLGSELSERENKLIANCIQYANNDPAGLPAHNLMIIINKLIGHIELSRQFPIDVFGARDLGGAVFLAVAKPLQAELIRHMKDDNMPVEAINLVEGISAEDVWGLSQIFWKAIVNQAYQSSEKGEGR